MLANVGEKNCHDELQCSWWANTCSGSLHLRRCFAARASDVHTHGSLREAQSTLTSVTPSSRSLRQCTLLFVITCSAHERALSKTLDNRKVHEVFLLVSAPSGCSRSSGAPWHAESMRTQQLHIQHFQLGRLSFSNVSSTRCFVSVPSLCSQKRAPLLRQIGQGCRLPVAARTSIRAPAQPSSLEAFPLSGSEQLRRQVTVAVHLCSSRQPSRPCNQVRQRQHPSVTSSTSGAAGGGETERIQREAKCREIRSATFSNCTLA